MGRVSSPFGQELPDAPMTSLPRLAPECLKQIGVVRLDVALEIAGAGAWLAF